MFGISGTAYSQEAEISVQNISVKDSKNIEVMLDAKIDTSELVEGDMKLMHDIAIENIESDSIDKTKVMVRLSYDLMENTSYNLITISWGEWSMVFETPSSLAGEELMNAEETWIRSITIVDQKNFEVQYDEDVFEDDLELKILWDISVSDISPISSEEYMIETTQDLNENSNYIYMLLSALTQEWSQANISQWWGIYNFETPTELETAQDSQEQIETDQDISLNAASEEDASAWETTQASTNDDTMETQMESETPELTEVTEAETPAEWSNLYKEENVTKWWSPASNLSEVAGSATTVPETGTATWILILFTLMCSFGIHMKMRK